MDARHVDSWQKICEFRIDQASDQLTFTSRLARENGWPVGYATRVVDEYRRFVFLAMTAGHEVTPSEAVDEAWHLHLTYTRSYLGRFVPRCAGAAAAAVRLAVGVEIVVEAAVGADVEVAGAIKKLRDGRTLTDKLLSARVEQVALCHEPFCSEISMISRTLLLGLLLALSKRGS